MIDMICDNCGAKIDANEEYCPNCGMQLLDLPPNPKKKRSHKSTHYNHNDSRSFEKPIKERYIGNSAPESPDYSQYVDEYEYGENELPEETYYEQEYHKRDYKEKSSMGIGSMILFLFLALVLGLVVGMIMFGPQFIPSIPGINI
ncbi:zinc-ribbon domain-containing protein [Methanobacterium oryzae]|uniref:zinc ribbon domain-containing protein n=1 Tax=Methanobacterium oryzae TaxID=69540 RepID=UPI003D231726